MKTLSIYVKIVKIIFQLVFVKNLSIWYIKKYVFNWYLKMATGASNGLLIEIKHNFVISPMIKRDGLHELLYYLCASRPLHASVCMCMQYLGHIISLFLWWRLENSLDIWLIPLVVWHEFVSCYTVI